MCGYTNDAAVVPPTQQDMMAQLEHVMGKMGKQTSLFKIFTSGSFFDDREMPPKVRAQMLEKIGECGTVKKIVAETRPEFVSTDSLTHALEVLDTYGIKLEIAVGLETSSDVIRKDCINKGFTFGDFVKASETALSLGVSTKAYLLLKPPFLSEKAAVDDMLASISDTVPYAHIISLNLCNVQKWTKVEELFNRRSYRPPWLWSAVFILKTAKEMFPDTTLISDPVGAGSLRGPHNCRQCDKDVAGALRDFSITQDTGILSGEGCECYSLWEKVMDMEDGTYGSHLVK